MASAATLSTPSSPSSPAPSAPPATAHTSGPGFWLQLGAFSSAGSARAALERLRRELAWLGARFDLRHEGSLYKVQAGPWPQREHALDAAARVRGVTALQPFPIFR
ncbi:MAG: SPOR domain-containing protein [Burkholderiaceae bacterium]|nr:SPOR domain-containing protein [Burkholderiaceae bacterium]